MVSMRTWSIIAWGLLCLTLPRGGWAEVIISGVAVDGRSLPITQEAASGADDGTARISSTARQITFAFEGEADAAVAASAGVLPPDALPPPRGTRLRFRLDGHDRDWRDRPAHGRVILRFIDADGQTVGSDETAMPGETAGWQGVAEPSPLSPSSFSAVAPPLATRVTINFVSGYEQVVGAMGFDDVTITVTPRRGAAVEHAFPFAGLGDKPHPLATPAGWGRSGSRGELSRVAMRSTAGGRSILTILDDDPRQYGSWALSERVAVQPGDTVTVSWRASHSFGAGGSLEAGYNGLPPGEYRFRVSACLPGGQPTGAEASLRVVIIPPWYRRGDVWLAIGLSAVAGAALAARQISLRRLRRRLEAVEQAHALERERARIARDLHDEVGAGLTEIAMQTAWLRRDIEATAPPETLLRASKACQAAIDLTRSVDAIVWAVNPANDTLDRFVSYLMQATEQFTDAAGLAVRFDVPAQIPTMPLAGTVRHGLFLIVREALNNAVKHARCTLIRLGVRLADSSLTITVADDGRGVMPTDPDHPGLGLASMQQRANDCGGTLEVAPQPGGGTRVAVTIPMPANTES